LIGGSDSLSILGLCPYRIAFHSNKPAAYSGHFICPSSTPRELFFFFPPKIVDTHRMRINSERVECKTRKTP
jgi:hypothetical protein